jgi:AraC-like DNA-binding protein
MIRIPNGFKGQRIAEFPFDIVSRALEDPITSNLVIYSMGYFPKAENHYIERPLGREQYILIYCVSGNGWYEIAGQRYHIGAGQLFVLPKSVPHKYGAEPTSPWTIYWIHFIGKNADFFYERLRCISQTMLWNEDTRFADRVALFEELINVIEGYKDYEYVCYANMSFYHLLCTFLYTKAYKAAKTPEKNNLQPRIVNLATNFMNENIDKRFTLSELASYVGYSKSYIYRIFYQTTQYSPMAYFQKLKIKKACELLENTHLKVNQIAWKLGVDDPYYFSRFFKQNTGQSPTEYRKTHI